MPALVWTMAGGVRVKNVAGLMTSEIATAIICVVVLSAVGFGWYVSAERDDMVDRAIASLEALAAQAASTPATADPLRCDDQLLAAELYANDFITLKIRPTPLDDADPDAGYGPGFHVESEREEDGEDAFVASERLYQALKESSEERLRWVTEEKDEIRFAVLASDKVQCENLEGQAIAEEAAEPPKASS